MWNYEKRLEYPVNITTPNPKIAQIIMSQYGGPDGEMGASMRYLSQRFTAPNRIVAGVLNDVGTEELAHLEMVSTIVHQLTCNLSLEEIQNSGFANYYVDHTTGIWPQAAGGVPFNSCEFQSKGDPLTDLFEDLAAEQKARSTYDNILRLVKDPEVADPIRFLRAREVVHFQRFGEALRSVQDELNRRTFMRLIRRLMQRLSVRHRSQGQVRGIAAQDSKLKIKEQHTTGKSHLKNRWDFLGLQ